MPLTGIQIEVARVLRQFRSADHYIGGGAALNRDKPRLSDDFDIFGDRDALPAVVEQEINALREAGYTVEEDRDVRDNYMVEVIVRAGGDETRIQWMTDPDTQYRFFPAQPDELLGFRLHDVDNAINKVKAASSRTNAVRDIVDIASIVKHISPLGPLVWASTAKPHENRAPLQIIRDLRGIAAGYTSEEYRTVSVDGDPLEKDVLVEEVNDALDQAADYVEDAPLDHPGHLFVDDEERPIEAADGQLEQVRILKITNFAAVPKMAD